MEAQQDLDREGGERGGEGRLRGGGVRRRCRRGDRVEERGGRENVRRITAVFSSRGLT